MKHHTFVPTTKPKPALFLKQGKKHDGKCVITAIRNAVQNPKVKDIPSKKWGRDNEQLVAICQKNKIPVKNMKKEKNWNENPMDRIENSKEPLVIVADVVGEKGKLIGRHAVATKDGWLMDSLKDEVVPVDRDNLAKYIGDAKKIVKIYLLA
jgi:hypothetical protein